jgi:hypothetical protein
MSNDSNVKTRSRAAALLLLLALATETNGMASVGPKDAAYFGGTAAAFASATDPVDGHIDTIDEDLLAFVATDRAFAGRTVSIPYASVVDVEYGQKAGRRVGAAIGYTALAGPAGLLALLSKKRNHYVTVGYTDADGAAQVAVFEIGKGIVRATLAIIEARSHRKVVYQDREARRSVG